MCRTGQNFLHISFIYKNSALSSAKHVSESSCFGKHNINTTGYLVIYFSDRRSIFLYSPCPNLEGIKDALSYKFRRLTIGQNCAMCTNEVAKA